MGREVGDSKILYTKLTISYKKWLWLWG